MLEKVSPAASLVCVTTGPTVNTVLSEATTPKAACS